MKMRVFAATAIAISLAFGTSRLIAQGGPGQSGVHVPDSSIEQPGDRGQRAHTNHVISLRSASPDAGSAPSGKWPSDISAAYNFTPGGGGTIAIVDAFDYPTAKNDFNVFSTQFGLPTETGNGSVFQVVYANGKPRSNCGWTQESALDIEWAHATAPNAKIVLVLAKSNSFTDLFQAVSVARNLPNVKQVSMSWGGSEFSGEASNDSSFSTASNNSLTFFAASGDTGGKTIYPGVSPNVVAAGGTSLTLVNGNWTETGWSGSGGGPSQYEPRPSYQASISDISGDHRGVPDFSFDADPNTGVAVYDGTRCQGLVGWMVFGGTSVSSPALSGIVNSAHAAYGTDTKRTELQVLYGNATNYGSEFNDVVGGTAGSFTADSAWDFVTGIGSNNGLIGK
jgi:subtilase family serine protease